MTLTEAQHDMDFAYFGGGTGVLVSGIVWCIASAAALLFSDNASMMTLFFGGMLIYPVGTLLDKLLKRSGKHQPDNPLGTLALESTVIIFVGLFLAFYLASLKIEYFYPTMLMIIGVRYLIFNTLYGNRTYWLLGGVLMASGVALILLDANFVLGAFIGGVTEIVFSFIILSQSRIKG